MPDFTVHQYGLDTSGRPLFMTAYMHAWLEAVKADPLVKPFAHKIIVTQGAFMSRVPGGGADASAGFHNEAGCVDFRSWNLTVDEVEAFIRACRKRGGAASHRLPSDGFDEEHIHCTLGGDSPYSDGAASSWAQYVAGTNGLANHAPDREWRPDPLVLSFVGRPKHVPIRVWFANVDWSTGGRVDRLHLLHLCKKADALLLVECKNIDVAKLLPAGWSCNQDTSSPDRAGSVVAWRTAMFTPRRRTLARIAARIIDPSGTGMLTRYANVQPLKVKASGERYRFVAAHYAPERYAASWLETTRALRVIRRRKNLAPVVIGTDANQALDQLGQRLHLSDYGHGIVGILLPAHLVTVLDGPHIDRYGLRHDATDHPAIGITIQRRNTNG